MIKFYEKKQFIGVCLLFLTAALSISSLEQIKGEWKDSKYSLYALIYSPVFAAIYSAMTYRTFCVVIVPAIMFPTAYLKTEYFLTFSKLLMFNFFPWEVTSKYCSHIDAIGHYPFFGTVLMGKDVLLSRIEFIIKHVDIKIIFSTLVSLFTFVYFVTSSIQKVQVVNQSLSFEIVYLFLIAICFESIYPEDFGNLTLSWGQQIETGLIGFGILISLISSKLISVLNCFILMIAASVIPLSFDVSNLFIDSYSQDVVKFMMIARRICYYSWYTPCIEIWLGRLTEIDRTIGRSIVRLFGGSIGVYARLYTKGNLILVPYGVLGLSYYGLYRNRNTIKRDFIEIEI